MSSTNGVEAQVVASEETSEAGAVLNGGEHSVNFINSGLVQELIHTESTSGKVPEPNLLDERALLACLVRAIPPESGSGITISSTVRLDPEAQLDDGFCSGLIPGKLSP